MSKNRILIFFITLFALTIALKTDLKKLNGIIENIENIKKSVDLSKQNQQQDLENEPQSKVNLCDNHMCGWGKECVVVKDRPICQCISSCSKFENDLNNQVCGNNNQTYSSLCELYRRRCVCKRRNTFESECQHQSNAKLHLEYLGECKKLDKCTDDLMIQFPARMSDWLFQIMKELKERRKLQNLEWEQLINQAEIDDKKKHVYPVIWKFCDLDIKPHDKHVSHHELIPITAPVIPMESCIKPFLAGCDVDKDNTITIKEWGMCLGLKEGEIQERC